ncbi:MAG TPA: ABC transporter ATP-binding protein [Candidatus Eisenbacteria bacterium]
MSDRVIETRGLRKQFGRKLAVADLSLSVGRGEVFGFLGPNGAGKTTSLKMLLGLVEPTAGRATVLGAPLGTRSIRAKLGFLPEHFRFHDWLTGRELLRFHGELLEMPKARLDDRIESLLARVDLLDAAPRKLREYSKGMLQRIGLAQALLNEPEVVFLDEPTSGLDPIGRLLVRDIIRDLKAQGTAVFLNSHLLGEVEATCDRVVFVKQGRAIRDLELATGGEDFEVELRFTPMSAALLEGLEQLAGRPAVHDGAVRLRVKNEETIPKIAQWLVEQGALLYRLDSRRPSLESTFLEVMGQDQRPG